MNKTIKKIVAVTGAAALIGMTMHAAVATTLSDYPQPFVNNGQFVGKIVIGEKANAIDVIGATDIAAALQRDASVATTGTGTSTATVSEGVQIKRTGSEFKYGQTISQIDASLDDNDLAILGQQTFKESKGETKNDVTYTQQLTFGTQSGNVTFEANTEKANKAVADYLLFPSDKTAYNYSVSFDTDVKFKEDSASDDLVGAKLNLQGSEYTITGVGEDTPGTIDSLTLMAGDSNKWVAQGDEVTVGDHKISITTVNENENKCGVKVDGTVSIIDVGDEHDFGTLTVGVLDAVASHAAGGGTATDTCELSIGSTEIVLAQGENVQVAGQDIEGSTVGIDSADGKLSGFSIAYAPQDKTYLAAGDSLVDPILGNFKIVYEGVVSQTEDIKATTTSNDGAISFTSKDGKAFELPLVLTDDNKAVFGNDAAMVAQLNNSNAMLLNNGDACDTTEDAKTLCNGVQMLVISTDNVAHIVELTKVNWDGTKAGKVDLKDLTTDKTYSDKDTTSPIDLGFARIRLDVDNSTYTVTATSLGGGTVMETKGGADVAIVDSTPDALNWSITEDKGDGSTLYFGAEYSGSTDDQINLIKPTTSDFIAALKDVTKDSDFQTAATQWGTVVTYDAENKNSVDVVYPLDQADAQVFVTPLAATVSTTAGGNGVTVNPIAVGMAITDSEATLGSKPYIVVGGPCANTVAATLMGNTADCTAGFTQGKAIIKLYSSQNALLVAGFGAKDTQGAARVLADYKTYKDKFTGTELEVVTANLNNLQVNKVQ